MKPVRNLSPKHRPVPRETRPLFIFSRSGNTVEWTSVERRRQRHLASHRRKRKRRISQQIIKKKKKRKRNRCHRKINCDQENSSQVSHVLLKRVKQNLLKILRIFLVLKIYLAQEEEIAGKMNVLWPTIRTLTSVTCWWDRLTVNMSCISKLLSVTRRIQFNGNFLGTI